MSQHNSARSRHMSLRSLTAWTLAGATVLLFWLLLFPAGLQRQLDGICLVECQSRYAVVLAPGDTLWLSTDGKSCSPSGDSLRADTIAATGSFISNQGHVLTSGALLHYAPDTLPADTLRFWLERERARLERLLAQKETEMEELDYYAATHTVVDDGYNEVMAYRSSSASHTARVRRLLEQLRRAERKSVKARLAETYRLTCSWPKGRDSVSLHAIAAVRRQYADSILLLQASDGRLPRHAFRFVVYATSVPRWGERVLGFFGPADLPDAAPADSTRHLDMPQLEGAPAVNVFGQLSGIRSGGRLRSLHRARSLYFTERNVLSWMWSNAQVAVARFFTFSPPHAARTAATPGRPPRNVRGLARTGKAYGRAARPEGIYCGRTDGGTPEGYGTMRYRDGSRYDGQWHKGRREGEGRLLTDSASYTGCWRADSLACGTRRDSNGHYSGALDHNLLPNGNGIQMWDDGVYYQGNWRNGQRDGFGFAVSERNIVQAGIWKRDRFQGEQIIYTANRVYGIDISRYQHEIRRRVYRIDWKDLRITSLGTASRKRIHGQQDYPVSFIYIKASEGISVRNHYYAADIAAARRRGIPAGAYHFFSTRRSGKAQARYFLQQARPRRGDLPPVLDVEPYDSQIRAMGGIDALFREVTSWLQAVEQRCGTKPILYVSQNFVNKYMEHAPAALGGYQVWIARYGEYKPYVRLLYWQLAADGRVKGIRGAVDINVYNGSRAQFEEFVRTACVKR